MVRDTWQILWLYESREVVAELYNKRHGVQPNSEKAIEISTCLAQGHQFFESSASAGELARPLLLFYGTVALAQGLILFLDPNKWLKNLEPNHGIGSQGWKRQLYDYKAVVPSARPSEALSLPLELQAKGTFIELLQATRNAERCAVQATDLDAAYPLCIPGSPTVSACHVSLKDVLSSLPDLRAVFERSMAEKARSQVGMALTAESDAYASAPNKQTTFCVIETKEGLLTENQLRLLFRLDGSVELSDGYGDRSAFSMIRGESGFPDRVRFRCFQWRHDKSKEYGGLLWPVKNDRNGLVHLVPPFSSGFTLSTLALLYLASFGLGMLARYHPTVSQALQSRLGSDRASPGTRDARSHRGTVSRIDTRRA